jgi:uncharacterized short protein YbdD (DUF466 family)
MVEGMTVWSRNARAAAGRTWAWVRRFSGEDAYDRYLVHVLRQPGHGAPLTRQEFEADRQFRKWDRGFRCC